MKKVQFNKIIAIVCAFVILSTTTLVTSNVNANSRINEDKIDELFGEMLHNTVLEASESNNCNMRAFNSNIENKNKTIEAELEQLGVVELTKEEVFTEFNIPSTKNIDIDKPENYNNVKWFKDPVQTYKINDIEYETVILRAIPGGYTGPLMNNKTKLEYTTRNPFEVGKKNFMKYYVNKGVKVYFKELMKDIPVYGLVMKFYDVIKSTVSGVSKTTEINEATSSINLTSGTEVKFVYVNKKDEDSYYQSLHLVTNRVECLGDWRIPNCEFTDDSFTIDVILGKNALQAKDTKWSNASELAAKSYANHYDPETSYVDADINLMEGKTAHVPVATPRYPIHLQ